MSLPPQRACYLSINPQKDEALETEKVQYTLPDGSTLDVSGQGWAWVATEAGLEEGKTGFSGACLPNPLRSKGGARTLPGPRAAVPAGPGGG